MEKELTELFESVKRAAEAAHNSPGEEDRCLDALKQLKKFPVNYQILLLTQVGKGVRQLTKHKNSKIKASASNIIEKWKTNIHNETIKITKNEESFEYDDPVKTECTFTEETNAVIIEQMVSSEIERKVNAKSTRTPKYDNALKSKPERKVKVKYPNSLYCKDSARDKAREILADALIKVNDESEVKVNGQDPVRVAASVETALFEKWGKWGGPHNKAKYRSVFFNIKDPKNPDFRRRVLAGDIEARAVPHLTSQEMASEERRAETEELEQKSLFNSERGGTQQASTDEFTCGRCRKKETTYYQVKMRSRDEHMTTFVTCVNCYNMWKF
ncbi:transcription elongation factor a protein 2 [Phtheirospermum japonicum]|uniref:Transcription elongation factor n=1 Tax=Phtheirospermum japonicum TaxID=374723 RepID=A0A830BH03_9LAMI|nr:transcription elongation factor a protein 2 [Phtheirospermum japonicum]